MAKDRKVIYTLGIATDPGAAKEAATLAQHFKEVEKAASAASKAAKEAMSASSRSITRGGGSSVGGSATDAIRAVKQRESAINRELDTALRERAALFEREKRMMADRIRANTSASAAARNAARETKAGHYRARAAAGGGASEVNFSAHVNDLGRQYAEAERLSKHAAAATTRAWREAGSAVVSLTSGVTSYGRAIVLATAADEESAQRMLQKIAKFEAFASVLTGTISLVKAGTSAWKAYQAAAAAAALAQGAGMAGGAARAGMGGLVAGGLAAGAKTIGGAIGSAASNPLTGVALVTAGTISAGYSVGMALKAGKSAKQGLLDTGNLLREGVTEFLGITDRAGDAAKAWKQRMESGRENIQSAGQRMIEEEGQRRELSGLGREMTMLGGRTDLGRARAGLQHSQRGAANAEQRLDLLPNYATKEARQTVAETLKNYRRQEIDDVREIARIEAETRREKIEGERSALGMLRDRSRTAQQMLQAERDAKKSAAARFGDLSDSDKARTIAAVRKAKAGGILNRDDRDSLRIVGGVGQTIADESAAREAYKKGFGEVAAVTHDPRIYGAQARVNNLSTKIETKNEIIVRMERDAEATANASYEKLKPLFQKLYEFIAKQDQATADKLQADLDREAALVNGTGGG